MEAFLKKSGRWGKETNMEKNKKLLLLAFLVLTVLIILGRLAFGTHAPTLLAQARVVNALPVALWLAGIAVYHLAPKVLPGAGSALPALAFSFALAWATRPKAR